MANELAALSTVGEFNAHHDAAVKSAADAVDNALAAGRIALAAKASIPHGEWEAFADQYYECGLRTTQRYMKAAKGIDALPKTTRMSFLKSVDSMAKLTDSLNPPKPPKSPPKTEETKRNASPTVDATTVAASRAAYAAGDSQTTAELIDDLAAGSGGGVAGCPPPMTPAAGDDSDEERASTDTDDSTDGGAGESVVLDALERPVPPPFIESHALGAAIQTEARKLDAILRALTKLNEEPGGEFINPSSLETQVKTLNAEIFGACYWSECPRCEGVIGKPCKECSGRGWWPQFKHGHLSAADKKWLGV